SACGVKNAASGFGEGLAPRIGSTANSGWNCADEPTAASTASQPSQARSSSSVLRYFSGVAATVKSTIGLPPGETVSMPERPRRSTTVAAPPPVVVMTATRGLAPEYL